MDNSQRRRKKKCIVWSCKPDPCGTVIKAKVILGMRRNWVVNSHPYSEKKNQHLENPSLETLGLPSTVHTHFHFRVACWKPSTPLFAYAPAWPFGFHCSHALGTGMLLPPVQTPLIFLLMLSLLSNYLGMQAKLISSLLTRKAILFPLPVFLVFISVWIHSSSIWVTRTASWRGIPSPLHKGITSFLHPQNSLPYC